MPRSLFFVLLLSGLSDHESMKICEMNCFQLPCTQAFSNLGCQFLNDQQGHISHLGFHEISSLTSQLLAEVFRMYLQICHGPVGRHVG